MTNPEQTPDTELEAQELTDESIDEVSGGIRVRASYDLAAEASFLDDQKEMDHR
jgi:hypothetical protein